MEIRGSRRIREVDRAGRRVAEFRPEILFVRGEFGYDAGVRAKTNVEVFECVIVDQIELNILVPTAFTRGRVDNPKQVQFGASGCLLRPGRPGRVRWRGWISEE